MKLILILLGIGILVIAGFLTYLYVVGNIELTRDIGEPLDRAELATDPINMDIYLGRVQAGMNKHEMTKGHWTWFKINENDGNDFSVAYHSVMNIRFRLSDIQKLDKTSLEYQAGLADTRGLISKLNIGQQSAYAYEHSWILAIWVFGWLIFFLGIAMEDYY